MLRLQRPRETRARRPEKTRARERQVRRTLHASRVASLFKLTQRLAIEVTHVALLCTRHWVLRLTMSASRLGSLLELTQRLLTFRDATRGLTQAGRTASFVARFFATSCVIAALVDVAHDDVCHLVTSRQNSSCVSSCIQTAHCCASRTRRTTHAL